MNAIIKFVVVYNSFETFKKCFLASPYTKVGSGRELIAYNNVGNDALPRVFNNVVKNSGDFNGWFVFCHQDFILNEDLAEKLEGKKPAVFGVIGTSASLPYLIGRIMQTDGSFTGIPVKNICSVQTLDEICIIVHSSMFQQDLKFDARFKFHFYGADLCMQASRRGYGVYAMQTSCQHKSRTMSGDVKTRGYLRSMLLFRRKWHAQLPIYTTTAFMNKSLVKDRLPMFVDLNLEYCKKNFLPQVKNPALQYRWKASSPQK